MERALEYKQTENRRSARPYFDRTSVIFFLVGIIVLLCIGFGMSSRANKNVQVKSENIVESGNLKTELLNLQSDWTQMPEEIYGILPNTTVDNFVYARNRSEKESEYVRIKVTPVITDEDGTELSAKDVSFDFNDQEWTYNPADGYWYYNTDIAAGETTTALYNSISFGPGIGNEYKDAELTVQLDLQAVQVSNNESSNVMDAAGWGE